MIANRAPTRVFVDLAPLSADGTNGGAAPFVLALLAGLLDRPGLVLHLLVKPGALAAVGSLQARGAQVLLLGQDAFEPRFLLRRRRLLPGALRRPLDLLLPDRASLRRLGADVLFSPLQTATFHEPLLRHVAVAYDFQDLDHPEFFTAHERRRRAELRLHLRRADTVVAISEATKDAAVRRVGVRPERLTVLPPVAGTRRPLTPEALAAALAPLELTPGGFAVYPANYWPHKNHARLLDALCVPPLSEEPSFRLVLCGALEAGRRLLAEEVERRGLSARVKILTYQPEETVTALIQGARLLVFPSLFEGFGIPVLEAFALGTAVACSGLPALCELAGDGAVLFDAADPAAIGRAARALWDDPELRRRTAAAGSGRARAVLAADTVGAYAEILAGA